MWRYLRNLLAAAMVLLAGATAGEGADSCIACHGSVATLQQLGAPGFAMTQKEGGRLRGQAYAIDKPNFTRSQMRRSDP